MNYSKKHIFFGVIIFILGFILGVFTMFLINKISIQKEQNPIVEEELESEQYLEFSLNKKVSVYLVWWDQDNGFEVIKNNTDKINRVSPFWYEMKGDASIDKFSGAESEVIMDFCKDNNIAIIPVITNDHDSERIEKIFDDTKLIDEHVTNIVDLVEKNDYDGIEIDYESLKTEDREDYSKFLTDLSQLLHENGRKLSVAVHAKTNDEGTWGGPAAQDWFILGQVCDEIIIMTYDYHWSTSEAGNIAPISWMQEVYEYAIQIIPKEKVFLGIHFYGYDWMRENAVDLTYEAVQELIEEYSPEVSLNDEGEKYFVYTKESELHTVYFSDSDVIQPRLDLVNQYDIGGVGIWRIGEEDIDNWEVIKRTFSNY